MEYRCCLKKQKNSSSRMFAILLLVVSIGVEMSTAALWSSLHSATQTKCSGGSGLKYMSGNALTDSPDCVGPNNVPYPSAAVARTFQNWNGNSRRGRQSKMPTLDPSITTSALLHAYKEVNNNEAYVSDRFGRAIKNSGSEQCKSNTPQRLCSTRYNTTAPMYAVSLTTGQPVTIVQKFPDLLQQVVFEVCTKSECDMVHGECTQTYVPYLFLVIPLGPVTLTGQDYVLVESGCVCRPQFSARSGNQESSMIP